MTDEQITEGTMVAIHKVLDLLERILPEYEFEEPEPPVPDTVVPFKKGSRS